MIYAYPINAEQLRSGERINAKDHHGKKAVCPCCSKRVQSQLKNKVWQWVHICPARKAKVTT